MPITASPGCALTSLVQPEGGNAQCIGNYIETVGACSFTALNQEFPAQCDSAFNCMLTYPGGTSHSLICNGSTQTYTSSVLEMSFSGSCTCTISGAASAPVAAASSSPPAAASTSIVAVSASSATGTPASSVPAAASSNAPASSSAAPAISNANKISKTSALLFSAILVSMLVSMA
ncbi:hypothetical protein INT43_005304 [Umbelopsis isabellina]|uniref:Uncharacterized protein n=1 Tax=Mortierella isabellina TaxID=91625 RepID=A0A8H7PHX6_MORIS|nr:hypothetical protein INT43_005304 [Umbelopsis isabellina]